MPEDLDAHAASEPTVRGTAEAVRRGRLGRKEKDEKR